jgi:diacylglycerol kinase (ATP)
MESPEGKRPLFILNPNAGIIPAIIIISKKLQIRKDELSTFKSLSIDDSGSHIKQTFNKHDVFIAAGGDGTVRTVASELIGTKKIFGVLPMGSGNGFAKELGFKANISSLLADIKKGESLNIDVIELNNLLCLNVAGVGLDSFVAHSFDRLKTRGKWTYMFVTLKNLIKLKPVHMTIDLAGETINDDLFDFTVANTRQFGNNAYIASDAKPNDGIIDIVLIKPFPKILAPLIVYRLFTKTLKNSKYVRYIKTDKPFSLRTDETRFHIDGEPVEIKGPVTVRLKREVLTVLKTRYNKL